jgi:hypothetical protein
MPRLDDMDLMQLHDDELADGERTAVQSQADGSADDRAKLAAMEQIGEVVRTHVEMAADDAEPKFAAMWAGIERRIQSNGERAAAPAQPAVQRVPEPSAASGGLLAAFGRWLDRHRTPMISSAVAAGAVAVLFLVLRPQKVIEREGPERIVRVPAAVDAVPASRGAPAQVEELTVVGGTGSILTIPGEAGENDTTVIWIEPDEDDMGGPI